MPDSGNHRVIREHCNRCLNETKHDVVGKRVQPGSETIRRHEYDEGFEIEWRTTYQLIECRGCEEVSVKSTYWFSEDPTEQQVHFYPPRVSRRKPDWFDELDSDTEALLEEIYAALHNDSRRLALMGARTVIDGLLLRQVGDSGSFKQRLDKLESKGFLSTASRGVLESALEAGHAAAHRGHVPDADDLSLVIDIIENVLQAERLPHAADQLRRATPGRVADTGATDTT